MAIVNPLMLSNRNGIPRLESTGVVVTTTDVRFKFKSHPFLAAPYSGLILIKLSHEIPTGTTGTLPVLFESGSGTKNVTTVGETNVTAADILGTGIHIGYYESATGKLQLLTGI